MVVFSVNKLLYLLNSAKLRDIDIVTDGLLIIST